MQRNTYIELLRREVYGGYVADDAEITVGFVNTLLNAAVGIAAKQNYKDAIQLDGVSYINNSFYTTFKNILVTKDENFVYKLSLPELPIGIGRNEGVSSLQFKDSINNISRNCVPISIAQKNYYIGLRSIPNKILYYTESKFIYALSTINLTQYTANIGMISGGDSTDLGSELNVPADYYPIMDAYLMPILMKEKMTPKEILNDGVDN